MSNNSISKKGINLSQLLNISYILAVVFSFLFFIGAVIFRGPIAFTLFLLIAATFFWGVTLALFLVKVQNGLGEKEG